MERIKQMIRRFWWLPLVVLLLLVGTFVIWASDAAQPTDEAVAALASTGSVAVDTSGDWLVFEPVANETNTGLIFYPGGKVDARAYAPFAQAIAENGYIVVIVPMPLNLAVFAPGRAADVIAAFPAVENWAIAGHSLGGSMAANFADGNPDAVDGVVLWASFPAGSDSLADDALAAVSIYGTRDGLIDVAEIDESRVLLPDTAVFLPIEGGNHAQFGWYGEQDGDLPPTISHAEQQRLTVEATVALLNQIDQ